VTLTFRGFKKILNPWWLNRRGKIIGGWVEVDRWLQNFCSSPELPTQQKGSPPEEQGTEIGAACFGPRTALLVQNPLNQATYDPGKALSRPIGEIGYGSRSWRRNKVWMEGVHSS